MQTRELTQPEVSEFNSCSAAGKKLVGVENGKFTAEDIVNRIEDHILNWHKAKPGFLARLLGSKRDTTQVALALGALWGEQLIGRFGWSWTCAQSDGSDYYCVASPDRSIAVYPTYYVKGCLDNPSVDCTIVLAFNMLSAGSVPQLPEGGLQNLMAGIQRVVPRREILTMQSTRRRNRLFAQTRQYCRRGLLRR